jgi:hypothetical protein
MQNALSDLKTAILLAVSLASYSSVAHADAVYVMQAAPRTLSAYITQAPPQTRRPFGPTQQQIEAARQQRARAAAQQRAQITAQQVAAQQRSASAPEPSQRRDVILDFGQTLPNDGRLPSVRDGVRIRSESP